MQRMTRTEALRAMKRLSKGQSLEPRVKLSRLAQMTDAELLDKLSKAGGDQRRSAPIAREIARRLALEKYSQ